MHPRIAPLALTAVPAMVMVATACTPKPPAEVDRVRIDDHLLEPADRQFATQPFDDQLRAGVVRQRTIFDYQFVPGSASLTPLGARDLGYLAEAMRAVNPLGRLSRSVAGTRGTALILNAPGSPSGAVECLEAVLDVIPHAIRLMDGA